jgi:hypothetical protein
MAKIKNAIIIDGVVHALVVDNEKDECVRCSLVDICNLDNEEQEETPLCRIYGTPIGCRFAQLAECERKKGSNKS